MLLIGDFNFISRSHLEHFQKYEYFYDISKRKKFIRILIRGMFMLADTFYCMKCKKPTTHYDVYVL